MKDFNYEFFHNYMMPPPTTMLSLNILELFIRCFCITLPDDDDKDDYYNQCIHPPYYRRPSSPMPMETYYREFEIIR